MKTWMIAATAAIYLILQIFPALADPYGPRHQPYSPGWDAPWSPHHRRPPPREVWVVYPPPPPRNAQVVYVESAPLQASPASDPYLDGRGRTCREYQTRVVVGGVSRPAYGTACLMPDGAWRIVR
ncbi:MAG: hypothetical protein HYU59_00750 [Magnetospirillum gryphiswaldense]|nr:hypothetical protein [Magnetospirillum gryphiswaldense]